MTKWAQGSLTADMQYNGDGQRMLLDRSTGGDFRWVWDGQNVLFKTDKSDATLEVETLEPRTFGVLVSRRRLSGGSFTSRHCLWDGLGSLDRETTTNQTVEVNKYVYNAFGEILSEASVSAATNWRFVGSLGYYTDRVTPAMPIDVRMRPYQPTIGRWIKKDPVGVLGGLNVYVYATNSPVYRADPFGLKPIVQKYPFGLKPLGQKWRVPDSFGWYYYGLGQDVPLDKIGLLLPWWADIKPQVLVQLNNNVVPFLESRLSCEREFSPSATIDIKPPFTIRVVSGGDPTDPLTVMGNSVIKVRGVCRITLQCIQCCAGERVVSASTGSCDLDFSVRDKFQNPLDVGGPFGKRDWPGATPYDLVASWFYVYTWTTTYDNPCPENRFRSD